MKFADGERILVIGLGRSGQASVDVLRARGAEVYVTDEKPPGELAEPIAAAQAKGALFVAPEDLGTLPAIDAAVLSPGVPLNGALVRRVQQANIPVYSEIEVAYRLCAAPIVAVTGTKGKSTTSSLIGHLLRHAGKSVHVGGNIGDPLIYEVQGAGANDWVVAEVSSFQLESIRSFRPRVSVILNIFPDHLDRYFSMDEYAEAKYRIFANQSERDVFVGNLDDERLAALHWQNDPRIRAKQLWFTMGDRHEHAAMFIQRETICYAPVSGDPRPVPLVPCSRIPLAGAHNVQNTMAAMLAAIAAGADPRQLAEAVESFTPMAHRLQPLGEIGGVLYVDDSKATNPGSVIAALRAYDRPIVLIAGGKSKHTDFTELGLAIDEHAKALVTIGEAAEDIAEKVQRCPVRHAESLTQALEAARALARPGDVVLLSPACASFDMFASAEDRGRQFIAAVDELRRAGQEVPR